jgi:hypothetical protein
MTTATRAAAAAAAAALTRSTEVKISLDGNSQNVLIELDLQKINPYFTCPLCKGYFKEACTIPECLHTFCKSCLVQYLDNASELHCPTCKEKVTLQSAIKPDLALQSLFLKLFPDVEKQDFTLEKQYYSDRGIPMPEPTKVQQQMQQQLEQQQSGGGKKGMTRNSSNASSSSSKRTKADDNAPQQQTTTPVVNSTNGVRTAPVKVKLTLQPEDPTVVLDKPYIEASGGIKVDILRSYIADKLKVNRDRVALFCNGQLLPGEHTTEFIQRTKWNDPGVNMVWTFRIA